jgi:hypothetical protein
LVVAVIVAGLATCASAHAANPSLTLADRYAPVVRLVDQEEPCKHGEAYQPTDVLVLGNPDVAFRGPWDKTNIIKVGPTASDLARGLFGYHLDFPGSAVAPGCVYDEWSHRISKGSAPRAYARVVTDPTYPGQLALQYWLFYVFNDFNDKHEGDWEMIQLNFDAGSAAEALKQKPALVGFSQHEGAESAHWGESKLEIVDGTHPVVYPALGSHANYYTSALHLGRSAAQGVGCDDTSGPSFEFRPQVSLILLKRRSTCAHIRGSASTAIGARSTRASTTGRPGRTRSCSGRSRSSGRQASGATRASPFRWERRSGQPQPTSSAAPSQPDRECSLQSSATLRRSSSRSRCCSR